MIIENGVLKEVEDYDIRNGEFIVPEDVIKIGAGAFLYAKIANIKLPEGLTHIEGFAFFGCNNITSIDIPKGVLQIGESAFSDCTKLTSVKLPKELTEISVNLFSGCTELTHVQLSEGIAKIGTCAFYNCSQLQNINLPQTITEIDKYAFRNCTNLTNINLPNTITKIGEFAFDNCRNIENIELPQNLLEIDKYAFRNCSKLKTINVPEGITQMSEGVFSNCTNLTNIKLPEGLTNIHKTALSGCSKIKKIDKNINKENVVINLENILNFQLQNDLKDEEINNMLRTYVTITNKLNKSKLKVPNSYIQRLIEDGNIEDFIKNADIKTFKSHMPNINEQLIEQSKEEQLDFYKFATVLGCFNTEKVLDKNGREIKAKISQKSSALLAQLLKTHYMQLGKYHGLFDSLSINTKASQDFLNFISPTGKGKNLKFENLELLNELEKKYPEIFVKVITDFEKVKSYRNCLQDEGKPITISWLEALEKFYLDNKYAGITCENQDIADIYASKGLSQQIFEQASQLRKIAKENNVPEHILGKQIKEQSILETIENIKAQTQEVLLDSKQIIDDLYSKQFTYEWLSKNDPRNSIIGLYCSCCATITSMYYGKNIASSTITAPDVQNIVINNNKGEIVAKGTMYVNKEKGYGVINDFEINNQYRKHEIASGLYDSSESSKEEQQRQLIFESFMRGIHKFVEEYDKQNKDNPIKQINVGMGYNRLKKQVERFEETTENLSIPVEYSFEDAMQNMQYVLYKKDRKCINSFEKNNNIDKER